MPRPGPAPTPVPCLPPGREGALQGAVSPSSHGARGRRSPRRLPGPPRLAPAPSTLPQRGPGGQDGTILTLLVPFGGRPRGPRGEPVGVLASGGSGILWGPRVPCGRRVPAFRGVYPPDLDSYQAPVALQTAAPLQTTRATLLPSGDASGPGPAHRRLLTSLACGGRDPALREEGHRGRDFSWGAGEALSGPSPALEI